jgi:hypothetical protein
MLVFDGLYCFGSSVCRLRVVCGRGDVSRVVLATDLVDAPGRNILNGFEGLVASVTSDFGAQPTRWLLHFPDPEHAEEPDAVSWTEGSPPEELGAEPAWRVISRAEAEEITGLDLSGADTEPATIYALAGNRSVMRGLARPHESDPLPRDYLQVVPVAALPFAHNPFRCKHHQRFSEIAQL